MVKTQQEMAQNQIIINMKTEASVKNLEAQIDQLYRQMETQASSSGRFIGNTIDNLKNKLGNRVVLSNSKGNKEKKESSEVVKKR